MQNKETRPNCSRYVILKLDYFHFDNVIDYLIVKYPTFHENALIGSGIGDVYYFVDFGREHSVLSMLELITLACHVPFSSDRIILVSSLEDAFNLVRGLNSDE